MGMEVYQRDLNHTIAGMRDSGFLMYESQQIEELRYSSTLIDRVLIRQHSPYAKVARYESDLVLSRVDLHQLRRRSKYTSNSASSPAGLVSIPLEELRPPRFLMLKWPASRQICKI